MEQKTHREEMGIFEFFDLAVFDALNDPYFPCRNRAHAVLWVLWNWKELRAGYSRRDDEPW